MPHARLVTLVGAGGSGKSRLALEVGGVAGEAFEHGACWVDLAAIDDEQFLPQAVASALGVRDQPGEELTRLLTRFLAARSLLLIVDNCEHVIAGAAALLHTLLQSAPRLHVLATSREPLRTEGERIWPVPPLSLPPAADPHTEMAYDCEAVQLFAERAKAALSSFTLSGSAGRSVVEIVRCLDGMPLAIELAAARVGALPVEQMAARLHDCFDVLGAGRRAALPRHQTLRAAIDWSYRLLAEDERRLLRQLSVFVDTFSLDAAEHVGRTPADLDGFVFDVMTRLIDKSLVVVTERPDGGRWRYRMLETVRQFAHEQLLAGLDAPAAFARHCQYYERLAVEVEPRINTADRQSCLTTLGREPERAHCSATACWRGPRGIRRPPLHASKSARRLRGPYRTCPPSLTLFTSSRWSISPTATHRPGGHSRKRPWRCVAGFRMLRRRSMIWPSQA